MKKRNIMAIGLDFNENEFLKAIKDINLITLEFLKKGRLNKENIESNIKYIKESIDCILLCNRGMNNDLNLFFEIIRDEITEIPIIPIGNDILKSDYFNIDTQKAIKINEYYVNGGEKNLVGLMYYIAYNFLNFNGNDKIQLEENIIEPLSVPFNGIFHCNTEDVFDSFESYAKWYLKDEKADDYKWIGILIHRSNWINGNTQVEKELIKCFETLGLKVILVFAYSTTESNDTVKNFDSLVKDYFSMDEKIMIDGLVHLMMLQPVDNNRYSNVFEQAVDRFKDINIPIFKPLISYILDKDKWEKNKEGLSMQMSSAFTNPEMAGMIEPIILGCRDKSGQTEPIKDRIHKFTRRVNKWIDLRNTSNKDKKIAIIIHNAPCSGVEATIGMGAGLEVFESVVDILRDLKNQGYKIDEIPENGEKLHKLIMDKKAYSDFRWTSVEDIIESGGCIYQMSLDGEKGYLEFYNKLEKSVHEEMEGTWGTPPGEGMVYDNKLIITGINFGNVNIMVQPKRGCYGAKCTGEVCKILHDPNCPPPHQYIATYKYIEEIMKANAVVHVGTGGSLEFLPGKTNALSKNCYSDITLGFLPNIYIYNAGIGSEGIIPKRRTNAVIIGYLPSCMKIDIKYIDMVSLINEYIESKLTRSNQEDILRSELELKVKEIEGAQEIISKESSFDLGIEKLKDYMVQTINRSKSQKLHIFGKVPEHEEKISLIKEYLDNNSDNATCIKKTCVNEYDYNKIVLEIIDNIINFNYKLDYSNVQKKIYDNLKDEVLEIYQKLILVRMERENFLKALEGKFIEPGLSGMPSDNFRNVLPTGRNLYLMNCDKIPTKAAYEVGKILANKLIESYFKEEGKYPNKVAMNMISTDISGAKGEQLSQILYLMGVIPVWDKNGVVKGLELISLEELNRPRIDITIRISGVLRDSYPDMVNLIDNAVVLVASLDESIEDNFVRKNTLDIQNYFKNLDCSNDVERRSTIRVFGNRPGTYGAGVDLALKASAWKEEKDIAKVFVYFSSYAYGDGINGVMAKHEFVENINGSDVSYQKTHSNRYDMISSCFSSSVHGGMNIVKKVIGGKEMKQYHGSTVDKDKVEISTFKEEIKENLNDTLFNPLWKEDVKDKGYIGAAEFMKRIQNIFDWKCLTNNVDDKDIDNLVKIYVNDEDMFEWFKKQNKYAVEEISRRFLELYERKKWNPDKYVLDELRKNFVKIEGNMEELSENSIGEIQGGNIEVLNQEDIEIWKDKLKDIEDLFK